MPTVATETPYRPVPTEPLRKRWTRQERDAFESTGLWNQQRLELIEGELITKMPKNRPHTNTLIVILAWLQQIFGNQFVNPETPIDVAPADNPTSEPEPDLIVLSRPSREIKTNPRPGEVLLVVEVSDSTVGFDLKTKAALYARAGIAEYWVADIPARRVIVHRDPREGRYQSVVVYNDQESVRPLAAPDQEFLVGDAFPE